MHPCGHWSQNFAVIHRFSKAALTSSVITLSNVKLICIFFTIRKRTKFLSILVAIPPYLNYVSTVPCKNETSKSDKLHGVLITEKLYSDFQVLNKWKHCWLNLNKLFTVLAYVLSVHVQSRRRHS